MKSDIGEMEMIRQARREYARQWRKNNADKVRKQNERYWLKKAHEAEVATKAESGTDSFSPKHGDE
jgi:hypothetical protein